MFGAASRLAGVCGPFLDVSDAVFCPYVLEIFTLGITTGTTPTTYEPASPVSRLQMAAFLSRTVDMTVKRGSPRAPLNRFWTPQVVAALDVTTVGSTAAYPVSDGLDVWVPATGGVVSRVRTSDGSLLGTWTGADAATGALSAMGKIFVTGSLATGSLYRITPRQPPGAVTTVGNSLGAYPLGLTFDGEKIWTANTGPPGSVSIVTPGGAIPWPVTTVTAGFSYPIGALHDGGNVWVTDYIAGALFKLDSAGAVLQTVTVGVNPFFPLFDGANIWVPNLGSNSISVVRASTGAVLATLSGNGLDSPTTAAFDGQRILVTNPDGDSVSLWKAADLTPLGVSSAGINSFPIGACSDGVNFWITIQNNQLARF